MNALKSGVLVLALSAAGCLHDYGNVLVNQRLEGRRTWDRAEAQKKIDLLSQTQRKALVPLMALALNDRDGCIRLNALSALGELDQLAWPVVPAVEKALEDTDSMVRKEAAITLARLGHPSGAKLIPELVEKLKGDEMYRPYLRRVTYWKLPYYPSHDPYDGYRAAAANDLWIIAEGTNHLDLTATLEPLIKALEDPAPTVRAKAAGALGAIGLDAASAVPKLRRLLWDPDRGVQVMADHALEAIKHGKWR